MVIVLSCCEQFVPTVSNCVSYVRTMCSAMVQQTLSLTLLMLLHCVCTHRPHLPAPIQAVSKGRSARHHVLFFASQRSAPVIRCICVPLSLEIELSLCVYLPRSFSRSHSYTCASLKILESNSSRTCCPHDCVHAIHATVTCSCWLNMSSSSSSSKRPGDHDLDPAKRNRIMGELAAIPGSSRNHLARTLHTLHSHGLLNDALTKVSAPSTRSYNYQIEKTVTSTAATNTPYGALIDVVELPGTNGSQMHYINPFSLIFHLCKEQPQLFQLLQECARGGRRLRVLLYMDGVNPGNPLAPDPRKTVQAIYWTFADLPNWLLRRKDGWFVFSIVRDVHVHKLSGKISELAKMILRIFWTGTPNFASGFLVESAPGAMVVTAEFAGFLADEKGLKEIFDIKGQAGTVPCWSCLNVRNRWVDIESSPGLQYFWDPDLAQRRPRTAKHVASMVGRLRESLPSARGALSTALGMNYCPTGVLFDRELMNGVIAADRAYIRDWMHTFCSGGVAGTELALICGQLVLRVVFAPGGVQK